MNALAELTRPWEICLVHHTHVDIGYTEPQDVILRKHAEFVAQALDYCTATDALPEGERFVWTCEVAWTVKAFWPVTRSRRGNSSGVSSKGASK